MPKSRSKRRTYAATAAQSQAVGTMGGADSGGAAVRRAGLSAVVLRQVTAVGGPESIGNYSLAIGFIPFIAGLQATHPLALTPGFPSPWESRGLE